MFLPVSRAVVIVLLISCSAIVSGQWVKKDKDSGEDKNNANNDVDDLLEKMLAAVTSGVRFFSRDYASINMDGLFGIRFGQGQIIQAMEECKSSSSCSDKIAQRLEVLNEQTDVTARAAMKYVKAQDEEYFNNFLATVDHPYLLNYVPRTLTDLQKTPPGYNEGYNEDEGDICLSRIMGLYYEHGKPVKECNITQSCWDMMTAPGRSRYSITHQVLYFIIIEKQGCLKEVEQSMGAHIQETEARLCGSIYNEAVSEAKYATVSDLYQDLFLEQVLVCGSLGYENFMRNDWMRMVLTWQNSIGCFTTEDPVLRNEERLLSEYRQKEKDIMDDLKWEANMLESQQHGRKLLREQFMKDGCLSHKSGLGFGTVSLFTRYLVRQKSFHKL